MGGATGQMRQNDSTVRLQHGTWSLGNSPLLARSGLSRKCSPAFPAPAPSIRLIGKVHWQTYVQASFYVQLDVHRRSYALTQVLIGRVFGGHHGQRPEPIAAVPGGNSEGI